MFSVCSMHGKCCSQLLHWIEWEIYTHKCALKRLNWLIFNIISGEFTFWGTVSPSSRDDTIDEWLVLHYSDSNQQSGMCACCRSTNWKWRGQGVVARVHGGQQKPPFHCLLPLQNQEFKEHPENFKSVGDFTLDGEGGGDIPKPSAKKKVIGKAGASRQHSLSGNTLALFWEWSLYLKMSTGDCRWYWWRHRGWSNGWTRSHWQEWYVKKMSTDLYHYFFCSWPLCNVIL